MQECVDILIDKGGEVMGYGISRRGETGQGDNNGNVNKLGKNSEKEKGRKKICFICNFSPVFMLDHY